MLAAICLSLTDTACPVYSSPSSGLQFALFDDTLLEADELAQVVFGEDAVDEEAAGGDEEEADGV